VNVSARHPLVAHGRLVVAVPAVLLLLGFVAIGLVVPADRWPEHVGQFVSDPAAAEQISVLEGRLSGLERARDAASRRRHEVVASQMLEIARREKVRDCVAVYPAGPYCPTSRIFSRPLMLVAFWLGLAAGLLFLAVWLSTQLRDSWMLPHWNPQLWHTPFHVAVVAPLTAGPFLMLWLFHLRVERAASIEPEGWLAAQIPFPVLLVLVLQLAAVTVASVAARLPTWTLVAAAAVLAGVGPPLVLISAALLEPSSPAIPVLIAVYGLVAAFATPLVIRARLGDRPPYLGGAPFLRLTIGLVPAYVALAVAVVANDTLVDVDWLETSASVVCGFLCAMHLATSQARELGLRPWRGARGSGRPA
jgi:hypothetical protein